MDRYTVFAILALGVVYIAASLWMNRWPSSRQAGSYCFGLLSIFFALTGPLDQLTNERLFTAYILQQMILVLVAAPFLLLGLPDWMLRPVFTNRWLAPFWRRVTRPLVTFLIFSAVFALIHYPAVCDRICHVQQFYGGIRALLVVTGLLLWWPLFSPLAEFPPLSYPLQVMYLFLLTIPMIAVAAPITLADSVLYMFYRGGMHPWGLTPLDDQVMGGLLMWVGQAFYVMTVFTTVFIRWSKSDDDHQPILANKPTVAATQIQALRPHDRPTF
ncbi:MAG: cytochrome c oxidase assembly protein [Candidatus Binataceae bacterium]